MVVVRTIFVTIPVLLTLVALAAMLLAFTGNVSSSSVAQRYYFLSITTSTSTTELGLTNETETVGFWNTCVRPSDSSAVVCNATQAGFFFDPLDAFNLTTADLALLEEKWPAAFADVLDMYRRMTSWAFGLYAVAIGASAATLLAAQLAYRQRLGSLLALLCNIVAGVSAVASSALYTFVFASIANFVKEALADVASEDSGLVSITPYLNTKALAATWLGAGATAAAFLFWAATSCCCAGQRYHGNDAYRLVERQSMMPPPAPGQQESGFAPAAGAAAPGYGHAGDEHFDDAKPFPAAASSGQWAPATARYEPYRK